MINSFKDIDELKKMKEISDKKGKERQNYIGKNK